MEKCQELLHQVQNDNTLFDLIATTDLDQIISSATLLEELKPPPQNQYYYRRYIDIAKAKPVNRCLEDVNEYISNFHEHRILLDKICVLDEKCQKIWNESIHASKISVKVDELCEKIFDRSTYSIAHAKGEIKRLEHICENSDEIISAILSVDATLIKGKQEWKDINKKVIHFEFQKYKLSRHNWV